MSRSTPALLLAFPVLMLASASAPAQAPGCGPAGYGPSMFPGGPYGGCSNASVGGFCFRFLSKIHFHGPLYNYGPYSGYYPFEPYGPWNSNLQYTGPLGPQCGGCGHCGLCRGRLRDLLGHGDGCSGGHCGGWGKYAKATLSNIFHRTHPCCKGKGCDAGSCGSAVSAPTAGCVGCAAAAVAATGETVTRVKAEGVADPALPPARRER